MRLIAWREMLEDHIRSQLIKESKTKRAKALSVTHHIDCMKTN
jgi:hypothetical protein